jgi:hypothetical protein
MQSTIHVYKVRPRKDKRGTDLISDVPPFSRCAYAQRNAAAKRDLDGNQKLGLDLVI